MKRYNTPHRSRVVKTRMTEEEYAEFAQRLSAYHMSQAEFIRQAITGAAIRPIITVSPVNDELLAAVGKLTADSFKVKINDRRILKAIFTYAGFAEEDHEKLAIIFDKLDKIGIEGVQKELEENAFDASAIEKFIALFESGALDLDSVAKVCDADYVASLKYIMDTVTSVSGNAFPIEFTPSLVRGQGYYTGTIFEVEAEGYSGAVAGGGRYDNLIGKFLNEDIPAVGFSIGFERIFGILMDNGYEIPGQKKRIAVFYDPDTYAAALQYAEELRSEYLVSTIARPKKLGKFLNRLETAGYDGFAVYGQEDGVKLFS